MALFSFCAATTSATQDETTEEFMAYVESVKDFRTWMPHDIPAQHRSYRRIEKMLYDLESGEALIFEFAERGEVRWIQRQMLESMAKRGVMVMGVDSKDTQETGTVRLSSTPKWTWLSFGLPVLGHIVRAFHDSSRRGALRGWVESLGRRETLSPEAQQALLARHSWEVGDDPEVLRGVPFVGGEPDRRRRHPKTSQPDAQDLQTAAFDEC